MKIALRHQFQGFDLSVDLHLSGGVTALFGPSGSGKTTLVQAVAGLIRPDEARIEVGGRLLQDSATGLFVPPPKRRIGYVFQEARLFPHMSVRQNLNYGRWFARARAPRAAFGQVVALLGVDHLLDRSPAHLSGGEKSRVAIGRALLSAPDLLLLDEPLAALDPARKAEILPYLIRLRDEVGVPMIYVSHAPQEVAQIATEVVALRAGRVVWSGPVERAGGILALAAPALTLSAEVLAAQAGQVRLHTGGGELTLSGPPMAMGARLELAIRPEDVILSLQEPVGLLAMAVLRAEVAGIDSDQLTLRLGPDLWTLTLSPNWARPHVGQPLWVGLKHMTPKDAAY